MIDRAERRVQNDESSTIGRDILDQEKLVRENQTLQFALDQIVKEVAIQEACFRGALSRTSAWAVMEEQRAARAVVQLDAIERSLSWYLVSNLNSRLDRFPWLRAIIKRCVMRAIRTAIGQLPSGMKQFRATQRFPSIANAEMVTDGSVEATSFFVVLYCRPHFWMTSFHL